MAFLLSTETKIALLSARPSAVEYVIGDTISFGDGDGTGGNDTINDSGNGFGSFEVHDFVLIIGGAGGNSNVFTKVLIASAGILEVPAGTLSTGADGTNCCIVKISSGSVAEVFKNFHLDIYSGTRPISADLAETGTKLVSFSLNGGTLVAGSSENGMNFGHMSGAVMGKAIDPVTGIAEVMRGIGLVTGTAGYGVIYDNAKVTGASPSRRMYGTVDTSGADINLTTGRDITEGVYSEVVSISATMTGVAVSA